MDYKYQLEKSFSVLHDIGNSVANIAYNLNSLKQSIGVNQETITDSMVNLSHIYELINSYTVENKFGVVEKFSVKERLEVACASFRSRLEQENIFISLPENDFYLCGPTLGFDQIIFNLLVNAVEAIKPKGMAVGKINISLEESTNALLLKFSDNGIGIRKENLRKIFAPGFSTKNKFLGGLGLCNVYSLLTNKFRGEIRVASRWRHGATFTLIFPSES